MIKLTLTQGISSGYFWPVVDSNGDTADLTGWTAACQVRSKEDHASTLLTTLNVTNGDGGFAIQWTAEESLLWDFKSGYFDVVLIDPDGEPKQILVEGMVVVNKVVTNV